MGLVVECWKQRTYKVRRLISKSKDRNGQPSTNQGLSTAKPRHGHAVFTMRVDQPTALCLTLSAHTEPISQGHCQK